MANSSIQMAASGLDNQVTQARSFALNGSTAD